MQSKLLSCRGPRTTRRNLIRDSFDRSDSASAIGTSDSGQLWAAQSGTWGISSNQAYLASTTSQASAYIDSGFSNGTLFCDVTLSATTNRADTGLIFRGQDDNNYMMLGLTKIAPVNALVLYTNISGTFTPLSTVMSGQMVNGQTYKVKITFNGTSINVLLDSINKISLDNATGITNTKIGIRENANGSGDDGASRFENFIFSQSVTQ